MNYQQYLREVAEMLEESPRLGMPEDTPEGARYIRISDTLARQIARRLRDLADINGVFEEACRELM